MNKTFFIIGALIAATAVAIGAYGAHGGAKYMNEITTITFGKGVRYQMYHAFAILITSLAYAQFPSQKKILTIAASAFVAGVVLFSGSLYLIIFAQIDMGYVTPSGGTAFMVGWLLIAFAAWREKGRN